MDCEVDTVKRCTRDLNKTDKKERASAAAALVKMKAKQAVLLVKMSFLEEKYELEATQLAIKRQLEELEFETKMAEVTAKLAVLNASKKHRHKNKSLPIEPRVQTQVPTTTVPAVIKETRTDDDWDGFNWEPPVYVPTLVGSLEPTGAGSATQMADVNCSSSPVRQERQEDFEISLMDHERTVTLDLDTETCSWKKMDSTEDEEQESSAVPVLLTALQPVVGGLLQQKLACSGPDMVTPGHTRIFPLPQWRSKSKHNNAFVRNTHFDFVVLVNCLWILYVLSASKMFKLKLRKAFKRKRWK
ncbi:unnamed protein product [Knipowitschia caucasica]